LPDAVPITSTLGSAVPFRRRRRPRPSAVASAGSGSAAGGSDSDASNEASAAAPAAPSAFLAAFLLRVDSVGSVAFVSVSRSAALSLPTVISEVRSGTTLLEAMQESAARPPGDVCRYGVREVFAWTARPGRERRFDLSGRSGAHTSELQSRENL